MTTQGFTGNKVVPNVMGVSVPLPLSVGPHPSLLFKFGGGVPHQQQSSTNQWDLLSGKQINCLNAKSHWPDHTIVWPLGFLQTWLHFPPLPQMFTLPEWGGGSQTSDWRPLSSGTLPHHGERCCEVVGLPGGPVVTAPCFHCRGHGFYPWSGGN